MATDKPHVFIHIPPDELGPGSDFERRIVEARMIKYFKFNKYKAYNKIYKDKPLKYKISADEKVHCFVLYADGKFLFIFCKYL